jgi:eukaryotic-like serine/threonine-protein kinase
MTQAAEDDDPRVTRARARLGTLLQEKWTLDSLLGAGGMAAVYGATHRNGKRVAIKMLHAELSHDEEIRRRFLQEGYAANAIQHDGAVSVLDDDVTPDGSAFLVMELLEGETVEGRWERGGSKLPAGDTLSIADALLDVLASAHDKSVVHRDIKPENVFITKAGTVKVLDFGIAKVFEQRQSGGTTTRAGTIMGTPAFMAPEQALARWDQVDGRTDLWAVGAMMFTLLTGRHVHEAPSNQEQLIRSATTPAPRLRSVAPDVPADVATIVDRALTFEQAGRWADARAMQQAVRVALEARGGSTPLGTSGRSSTGTLVSRGAADEAAHPRAATMIDTTRTASSVAAWMKEREMRIAEATKLRASIADLQQRVIASRKGIAEAQAKVETARAERASLEHWFKRQTGTRTAAVEEARAGVRLKMVALAERALEDRETFGADLDPARQQIAKLKAAAKSVERDVAVHVAAIDAYEPASLRSGVVLLGVAAVLALSLLVGPIVWRATRVIDPGPPPAAQHTK